MGLDDICAPAELPDESTLVPSGPMEFNVYGDFTRRPELTNQGDMQRAMVNSYAPLVNRGVSGVVQLWLRISESGTPSRVCIAESDNGDLNSAAINVGRIMRFVPAQLDGEAVAVWMSMPLRFQSR